MTKQAKKFSVVLEPSKTMLQFENVTARKVETGWFQNSEEATEPLTRRKK